MKKRNQRNLWITVSLLMAFVLWTAAISFIDVFAGISFLKHKILICFPAMYDTRIDGDILPEVFAFA